ncbi:arginine--tRNA ligase [Streptomyces sp. MUM 203J]|uniref:ArgS-related anticodon-binding protein NrtL n=1 Tax=Streptomyces sp. MUM 203J TaxID=2791990 RepID=UPI001F042DC9|nr:DALR anticodon-binding domain-containing protein [Streptomyces sp. MUM 203J]MCH0538145.1 arginine--tRNA ligase [Streptomyces sp. MUM 203J]
MTPAELSHTVLHAVRRAVGDGALQDVALPPRVLVERPRAGGRGDWATNAALQLAGSVALPPREVAEILRARLLDAPGIARVDITGPGFLNLTLSADTRARADRGLVERVLREGPGYGAGEGLRGVDVELALDEREVRARVVGEAVARLVERQGGSVRFSGAGERLSVRAPHYDVAARLGADAARWACLRPAAHDRVPEPGSLLRQAEGDNGLFTVQYAHSRARALLRNAAGLGVHPVYEVPADAPRLIAALRDHPLVLLAAARHRAPDRLARHLEVLADALLGFQHTVLPLGDQKPSAAHRSRLALAEAAGTVLAGGLTLLGISAPVHL